MDIEKTKMCYKQLSSRDLCNCEYCQNYIREIKTTYSKVSEYLFSFGVDIEKPLETIPLEPDEKGKKQLVEKGYLYYSDAEDSRTEINNVLCKLGNYDAKIVIKKDRNNTVIVDVRILRGNTVYYSEDRTVELKNNVVLSGTDDTIIDTSKETSKILYIGSLE